MEVVRKANLNPDTRAMAQAASKKDLIGKVVALQEYMHFPNQSIASTETLLTQGLLDELEDLVGTIALKSLGGVKVHLLSRVLVRKVTVGEDEQGMISGLRDFFVKSDGVKIKAAGGDSTGALDSLIQNYEARMNDINVLDGSGLRIETIRSFVVQVGALPAVRASCSQGDGVRGLKLLAKRGLTCFAGRRSDECLKDAVCVALNYDREFELQANLQRQDCSLCKHTDNSLCCNCAKIVKATMKRLRVKTETWDKYRAEIKDEGVCYPASDKVRFVMLYADDCVLLSLLTLSIPPPPSSILLSPGC